MLLQPSNRSLPTIPRFRLAFLLLVYATTTGISSWVMLPAIHQVFDAKCTETLSLAQQNVRGAERQAAVAVASTFVSSQQCSLANTPTCGNVCTWDKLLTRLGTWYSSLVYRSVGCTPLVAGSLPVSSALLMPMKLTLKTTFSSVQFCQFRLWSLKPFRVIGWSIKRRRELHSHNKITRVHR